jgi:predicted nucleotidyltransferase
MDRERLAEIARRHGARLILQFGSTVAGRTHPGSDLDLAILLERGPFSLSRLVDISTDLQPLSPDRNIDLALLNRADPLFLKTITEACVPLFGTDRALAELKIYAFKRYQDHRRFLALERDYVAAALKRHAS